jgi:hypothetical protein
MIEQDRLASDYVNGVGFEMSADGTDGATKVRIRSFTWMRAFMYHG